jgi:hypothetical protein
MQSVPFRGMDEAKEDDEKDPYISLEKRAAWSQLKSR